MEEGATIRQRILHLLKCGPLDARQMADQLCITEKEVIDHLEHVIRSLGGRTKLSIQPAYCISCAYVFRDRTRLSTPSKCPKCKGHRIAAPAFHLKGPIRAKCPKG